MTTEKIHTVKQAKAVLTAMEAKAIKTHAMQVLENHIHAAINAAQQHEEWRAQEEEYRRRGDVVIQRQTRENRQLAESQMTPLAKRLLTGGEL